MALPSLPPPDLEADLLHWRFRTMNIVLWTILAMRLIHMTFFLKLLQDAVPVSLCQLATLSPILVLAALTLFR